MADRYCIECGGPLEPTDRFCPSCGAMVPEEGHATATEGQSVTVDSKTQTGSQSGTLRTVMFMSAIWGVIALVSGAYIAANAAGLAESSIEAFSQMEYSAGKSYWDALVDMGYSHDMLVAGMQELGIFTAASGLLALVTAYLCNIKAHYTVALIILVVSSLLSFSMIFTLVIGLVFCYYLTKCKQEFAS